MHVTASFSLPAGEGVSVTRHAPSPPTSPLGSVPSASLVIGDGIQWIFIGADAPLAEKIAAVIREHRGTPPVEGSA